VIIAETGGDMSAFPTAKHLASWAGVCPGNDESAGKRRSGKARKGSKWLGANLIEAATAASRTKDTYLQAQYQRLRARRGHARAITALAHSMRVAAWHARVPQLVGIREPVLGWMPGGCGVSGSALAEKRGHTLSDVVLVMTGGMC
jgi:hypothetical protein